MGRGHGEEDSRSRRFAPTSPASGRGEKEERSDSETSIGCILALAYPDRIAKNRGPGTHSFLLANGRGGGIDPASSLAREPFIAVAELAGKASQGRIVLAAPISPAEIEARFAQRIESREEIIFDKASVSLRARRSRRLGAVVLNEQTVPVPASAEAAAILGEGLRQLGLDRLPWTKASAQWRDRVLFLRRAEGEEWPDLSDAALSKDINWLVPFLEGKTALSQFSADEFAAALQALLPYPLTRRLDQEAPTHFTAPTGSAVPIEYTEEGPKLSIRVQELFGLDRHPAIAKGKTSLMIELLSPAHRPVQVTRDLPSFWRGSYAAVKAEMRGRYPRHPWPDDPARAAPTRRAKPRGT
jgi:ATP-dependent helicase HrpB